MHLAPPIANERALPLRRMRPALLPVLEEMLDFNANCEGRLQLPDLPMQPFAAEHWPKQRSVPTVAQELVTASLQELLEHTGAAPPPAPGEYRSLPPLTPRQIPGATLAAVPPLALPSTPIYAPRLMMLPLRPRFRFGPSPSSTPLASPTQDNPAVGPPPQEFFRRPEPGPPAATLFSRRTTTTFPFQSRPEPATSLSPALPVVAPSAPAAPAAPELLEPEKSMATTPKPEGPFQPDYRMPAASEPVVPFGRGQQSFGFVQRVPLGAKIGAAAGIALVGVLLYSFAGHSPATVTASTSANVVLPDSRSAGWTTDFAGDVQGASKGRQLMLFRQSLNAVNYDFNFSGQIAEKSLGWVIHAADPRNYYAMRIEVLQPGPLPRVSFYKFAVVNGQEGEHTQLPLPMTIRDSTVFHVQVSARNGTVTTKIQDQIVDIWNDDRVRAGAAGFVTERGERALIKSVDFTEKR